MRLIDADAIPWTDLNADMPNTKIKVLITFADKVNRMPTIEERKKGKWICSDDYYETGVCSACEWDVGEAYANCKKWFKFCPNCGADMRGDET